MLKFAKKLIVIFDKLVLQDCLVFVELFAFQVVALTEGASLLPRVSCMLRVKGSWKSTGSFV
jgi:hypothetical protein